MELLKKKLERYIKHIDSDLLPTTKAKEMFIDIASRFIEDHIFGELDTDNVCLALRICDIHMSKEITDKTIDVFEEIMLRGDQFRISDAAHIIATHYQSGEEQEKSKEE